MWAYIKYLTISAENGIFLCDVDLKSKFEDIRKEMVFYG